MGRVRRFFEDNEKVLAGSASIATLAALVFAGWQLKQTNDSLEASTVYELQKDGRELLKALREKEAVYNFIFLATKDAKPDPKHAADIDFALTQLVQYFSAVINQRRNGVISDSYWQPFNREMCALLRRPAVSSFWENRVQAGSYSDEFKEWGTACMATGQSS